MPAFEEEPETEPLNVADTRPAMLLGVVPYTWGVPSIMTAVAIDMKFHALFLGPCVMGPFLFLMAVLVRRDYWMFRVFGIYCRNLTSRYGSHLFGGASPNPAKRRG